MLADLFLHLRDVKAQHAILHLGTDLLQVCRLWQPHTALDPLRTALNPAAQDHPYWHRAAVEVPRNFPGKMLLSKNNSSLTSSLKTRTAAEHTADKCKVLITLPLGQTPDEIKLSASYSPVVLHTILLFLLVLGLLRFHGQAQDVPVDVDLDVLLIDAWHVGLDLKRLRCLQKDKQEYQNQCKKHLEPSRPRPRRTVRHAGTQFNKFQQGGREGPQLADTED